MFAHTLLRLNFWYVLRPGRLTLCLPLDQVWCSSLVWSLTCNSFYTLNKFTHGSFNKPYGDLRTVTGVGLDNWKPLAELMHVGGVGLWSLYGGSGPTPISAAAYMTKQPFLGKALLTSEEEGPRKGGLNIACPYY